MEPVAYSSLSSPTRSFPASLKLYVLELTQSMWSVLKAAAECRDTDGIGSGCVGRDHGEERGREHYGRGIGGEDGI